MRFFSSTVNRATNSCSSRYRVSKLVTKHSFLSSQYMQLMQILVGSRSLAVIGWKCVVMVLPDCDHLKLTSRLLHSHSSLVQSRTIALRSPLSSNSALCRQIEDALDSGKECTPCVVATRLRGGCRIEVLMSGGMTATPDGGRVETDPRYGPLGGPPGQRVILDAAFEYDGYHPEDCCE